MRTKSRRLIKQTNISFVRCIAVSVLASVVSNALAFVHAGLSVVNIVLVIALCSICFKRAGLKRFQKLASTFYLILVTVFNLPSVLMTALLVLSVALCFGYRAVLPYLLGRRAKEKIYYSPKRKYVVGVFENLLLQNQEIIKKMSSVTVLIVTCSPYKEMPPRDNDNADGHDIINIIRNYLMSEDDSGLYMNVFYDTRISEHYYTEVYVLPRNGYCY